MKEPELIYFADKLIEKYYAAAESEIRHDSKCSESDQMQALDEECCALKKEFRMLLD